MPVPDSSDPRVLSISRLTQQLQWTLREKFDDVWVSGEISNLTQPGSGHMYMTLADKEAQIRAVIWRTTAQSLKFEPAEGMQVVCYGNVDIYAPRGTYQLNIQRIEPSGVGAAQLAFKKLHAKLKAEGLFAAEKKRPLPAYPKRIAVVTSATGAAIHDFLQVVTRRWSNLEILIVPSRVQGEGSVQQIVQGIRIANRIAPRPDVLVVTRGGGSAEDLWSFNDEQVVRAIAQSVVPTVCGVGHEIDVTLADLAADVRALTPSQAGELVVREKRYVTANLIELRSRLVAALTAKTQLARGRLESISDRPILKSPLEIVRVAARRVDELELRLQRLMNREIERAANKLGNTTARLQSISPLSVLARGYSVTQTIDGQELTSISGVTAGETILTRLSDGKIVSKVQQASAFSGPGESS